MADAGTLKTDPFSIPIATTEDVPIGVDFSARLAGGESVTAVVSVALTRLRDGQPTPAGALSGSASTNGTIITQDIDGSYLESGERYRLAIAATITGGRTEASETVLSVEF